MGLEEGVVEVVRAGLGEPALDDAGGLVVVDGAAGLVDGGRGEPGLLLLEVDPGGGEGVREVGRVGGLRGGGGHRGGGLLGLLLLLILELLLGRARGRAILGILHVRLQGRGVLRERRHRGGSAGVALRADEEKQRRSARRVGAVVGRDRLPGRARLSLRSRNTKDTYRARASNDRGAHGAGPGPPLPAGPLLCGADQPGLFCAAAGGRNGRASPGSAAK